MDDLSDLDDFDGEVEIDENIESSLLSDDDSFEVGTNFSDLSFISSESGASDAYSLDALISKKHNLLIQSRLSNRDNSSCINNDLLSLNTSSQFSLADSNDGISLTFDNCTTSTPRLKTPAVKILDKWKPSFSLEAHTENYSLLDAEDNDLGHINKKIRIADDDVFASVDNYSNKLASYTQKDDQTIEDIMNELTACLQEADQTIDENTYGHLNERLNILDDLDEEDKTLLPDMKSFVEASVKLEQTYQPKVDTDNTLTEDNISTSDSNNVIKSGVRAIFELKPSLKKFADKEIDSLGVTESDEEIETVTIINIDEDTLLASDDENKQSKVKNLIKSDDDKLEEKRNKDDEEAVTQMYHETKTESVPLKSSIKQRDSKTDLSTKKKDTAAPLKEFVSDDPEENRDNNDPMWDYLRNLGDDFSRYLVVRKRWKNLLIPNPKMNMTCRFRRRIDKTVSGNAKNRTTDTKDSKPISRKNKECSNNNTARSSNQLCTVLFDRRIKLVNDQVQRRLESLYSDCRERLHYLADCQQIEKQLLILSGDNNMVAANVLDIRHTKEAEDIMRNYVRQREDVVSAANCRLDALRYASEEMMQLHEFYPAESGDGNTLVYLTEEEMQEIQEVDNVIAQYDEIYKKT